MLPLLMMRHRRIPRSKWRDHSTPEGKHWIEQNTDDMNPEKALHSKIGYSLMGEASLCGMERTQGLQERVTFIGLGIKHRAIEGKLTLEEYVQSLSHKLTDLEIRNITQDPAKENVLRRLSMVLACKTAYYNAIGSTPLDMRRMEFDIPNRRIIGDGKPLVGWEFRIFEVRLGVARRDPATKKDILVIEEYQCACAFYRGWKENSRFMFFKATKELEPWVQFINLDQMMKVLPKLSA
jgi:4'-phosphopantetheinyl transferase